MYNFWFQINNLKPFSDPQDAESDVPGWGNVNQAYDGEELQEPCEVSLTNREKYNILQSGNKSNTFPGVQKKPRH